MWFYITCIVIIITITIETIFRMKFKKDIYKIYLEHDDNIDGLTYDILKELFDIEDKGDE